MKKLLTLSIVFLALAVMTACSKKNDELSAFDFFYHPVTFFTFFGSNSNRSIKALDYLRLLQSMQSPLRLTENLTNRGLRKKKTHFIMKKVLTVVAVIAMVACLGSCKKKCNCVTTMNGEVVQTTTMEATNCAKLNVTQNMGGMTQEVKCN